jgi:hypothetical protein
VEVVVRHDWMTKWPGLEHGQERLERVGEVRHDRSPFRMVAGGRGKVAHWGGHAVRGHTLPWSTPTTMHRLSVPFLYEKRADTGVRSDTS